MFGLNQWVWFMVMPCMDMPFICMPDMPFICMPDFMCISMPPGRQCALMCFTVWVRQNSLTPSRICWANARSASDAPATFGM